MMNRLSTVRVRMPWSPRDRSAPERDQEAEIIMHHWKHSKILPPTSYRRNMWEWLLIVLVVYSVFQIPLILWFNMEADQRRALNMFDIIIDSFFGVDIILVFNTAYYVQEELVASRQKIFRHYMLGWFWADFAATVPWNHFSEDVSFLRVIRLLRLSRVIKKLDTLKGGMRLRFLILMFFWALISHWIACIWWKIGADGFRDEVNRFRDGLPASNETSWLVRIPPVGTAESGFSAAVFAECVSSCLHTTNYSRIECMSNSTCDDNNFNPDDSDFFTAWMSSMYWALTMLMKTPFVGPDTLGEKAFSCISVIIGAIIFALLLGQVTAIFIALGKAGAQLRDTLVTYGMFATSRRLPHKLHSTIKDYVQSDFRFTQGIDTNAILDQFPSQMKGDVLLSIYAPLLDSRPNFLRCSEQLKRSILSILKPAVALKKATVVSGRQFGATLYVLLKGTLQVSQAPGLDTDRRSTGNEQSPKMAQRGKSVAGKEMKSQITRMNTKGFKDKLKARILEKPGTLIPYAESVGEGPKPSVFSIFAVTRCKLFTLEAADLNRILKSYPKSESDQIADTVKKDFNDLVKSLKMEETLRESQSLNGGSVNKHVMDKEGIANSLTKMEAHAETLIKQIDDLTSRANLFPEIYKVLLNHTGVAGASGSGGEGSSSYEPLPAPRLDK